MFLAISNEKSKRNEHHGICMNGRKQRRNTYLRTSVKYMNNAFLTGIETGEGEAEGEIVTLWK